MAAAEAADINLDGLKGAVLPLVCRFLSPASLNLPIGIYSPATLPLQDVSSADNPTVNLFDIIPEYASEIDFGALERGFVEANRSCNMALLLPPFGFKADLPWDTKIQVASKSWISGTKLPFYPKPGLATHDLPLLVMHHVTVDDLI